MVRAQGGNPDAPLPQARHAETVRAGRTGIVGSVDAMAIGTAAWELGAGRSRPGQSVSFGAGVRLHAKPGDGVTAGSPMFTLYTDDPARLDRATAALAGGWRIGDRPPPARTPVLERHGARTPP